MTTFRLMMTSLLIAMAGTLALSAGAQETTSEATDKTGVHTFDVDAVHSTTIFRVHHMGAGMFYGRFNDVGGTIEYDTSTKKGLALDLVVDVNSVDSGNERLDGHLKSPDFFNAVEFPKMTFKSTSATLEPDTKHADGDVYKVEGDLTIHGVTKKISVEVVHVGHEVTRRGERIGFECVFTIKRSEFDMPYGVEGGALGNSVQIIVSLEAAAR
ncbi:MAG: YceI family protein [Phycisphaerales bacterium]|nr:YceI family protein [Phycisphaerales bacterium]